MRGSDGHPRRTGRHLPPAPSDLDLFIGLLTDELAAAMEREADGAADSRSAQAAAVGVLARWLQQIRVHLSDPSKADVAMELILSTLDEPAQVPPAASTMPAGSTGPSTLAAERAAALLGDDAPMAMVWVAAGLASQFADSEPGGRS